MSHELTFVSAFLVGLVGSVHCIGMCGGIVGALTLSAIHQGVTVKHTWLFVLLYNAGRISSYVFAGVAAAFVGQQLLDAIFMKAAQWVAGLLASGFMFVLGLYVAGWWPGLVKVEQLGHLVWRYIEPLSRGLIPVKSPGQALILGLIWGWLPCGMVYTALVWSLAAGSPDRGGLLMLGFGLGTLPALLVVGGFAGAVKTLLQKSATRKLAGTLIMLFAVTSLVWLIFYQNNHTAHETGHLQHQH